MTLYSLRGFYPEPLPLRITLSNGFTRTDPSTFTAEEIQDAGYIGPLTPPVYDPTTHKLGWNGTDFVLYELPPAEPTPEWVGFAADVMADPLINQMLGSVFTAAPGLYGGLVVGLQQASDGDTRVFLNAWDAARTQNLVPSDAFTRVMDLADARNLPAEFLADLVS